MVVGSCQDAAGRLGTRLVGTTQISLQRKRREIMDASSIVETGEPVRVPSPDDVGVSLDDIGLDGTGLDGTGTLVPARNDDQFEMDRLLDRLDGYATGISIAGVPGLGNDVLRAWEYSLAAGDVASVNRLVVLAHAIRAADNRRVTGMIG